MPKKTVDLPDGGQGARAANRPISSLPDPGIEGGNPFLKAKVIGKKGGPLKILGNLRQSPTDFSDFFIDVSFGGKPYTLGLKVDSGNYLRLFDRFGKNPAKWKGTVNVVPGKHMGRDYPKITDN